MAEAPQRVTIEELEARIKELETLFRQLHRPGMGFSSGNCTNNCTVNCTVNCTDCCTGAQCPDLEQPAEGQAQS